MWGTGRFSRSLSLRRGQQLKTWRPQIADFAGSGPTPGPHQKLLHSLTLTCARRAGPRSRSQSGKIKEGPGGWGSDSAQRTARPGEQKAEDTKLIPNNVRAKRLASPSSKSGQGSCCQETATVVTLERGISGMGRERHVEQPAKAGGQTPEPRGRPDHPSLWGSGGGKGGGGVCWSSMIRS